MHQPDSLPITEEQQPRPGYETRDVNPFYVGLFGLGLLVMVASALVLLGWMFRRLEKTAERLDPPQSPVADSQTPPLPRLQTDPSADLAQMRSADQQALSSYGWSGGQKQKVRIPVDRAIEILVERGFPEPPPPPPSPPPQSQQQQPQERQQREPVGTPQQRSTDDLPRRPAEETRGPAADEPQEQRRKQPLEKPESAPQVESDR